MFNTNHRRTLSIATAAGALALAIGNAGSAAAQDRAAATPQFGGPTHAALKQQRFEYGSGASTHHALSFVANRTDNADTGAPRFHYGTRASAQRPVDTDTRPNVVDADSVIDSRDHANIETGKRFAASWLR